MYNYWTPTLFELFLEAIADAQLADNATRQGFVPVVVPCHGGVDARSNDLSWSSAFVLIVDWLVTFYDALPTAARYWDRMVLWMERQLEDSHNHLPSFSTYGDDGQVGGDGHGAQESGPAAAAGQYLLCLEAMQRMASALGKSEAATEYTEALLQYRKDFNILFWNESLSAYASHASGIQVGQVKDGRVSAAPAPVALTPLSSLPPPRVTLLPRRSMPWPCPLGQAPSILPARHRRWPASLPTSRPAMPRSRSVRWDSGSFSSG